MTGGARTLAAYYALTHCLLLIASGDPSWIWGEALNTLSLVCSATPQGAQPLKRTARRKKTGVSAEYRLLKANAEGKCSVRGQS